MGRYFVLSEWRGPESLCRRDQKGAMKRRPRHSSGDTTIIPHERLRQSGANGQRERSFGSSRENKTVSGTVSSRPHAIGDALDQPALGNWSRGPLR